MTGLGIERPTRRGLLAGSGALIVSFSMLSRAFCQEGEVQNVGREPEVAPELPGSLSEDPILDSWIRIDPDGGITVFTGKAELGQGVKTAIIQIAAEELEVDPAAIELVTADTGRTPNEGFTAGSQSMQNSGTGIRHAAVQVREILIGQAAGRLQLGVDQLRAEAGAVVAPDGRRLPYGELVEDQLLHIEAVPQTRLKPTDQFRIMGTSMPRVDIPAKVTGGPAYVQDMRLPRMLHARIIRPPSYQARLLEFDAAPVEQMPGVVSIVRDGSFLAVVAEKEFQAIKAMRALSTRARWQEEASLPPSADLPQLVRDIPVHEDGIVAEVLAAPVGVEKTYEATFTRPYQIHGSIGPSCAVGLFENGVMTVWTHTQGVYPDRKAIAEMLGMPPEQVRCIHTEGSGCYGHNAADDAAADAALLAHAVPGRPVRVQWMREQEHAWEPFGPAMVTHVRAGLNSSGRIAEWNYELWSNTHTTRPGPAGALLAARHLAQPFPPQEPKLQITPSGNGDRNADPLYTIPSKRVVWHFLKDMPLRVSALRALGAYANVFSVESTMDELAIMAGVDPVEFRLRHLDDPRARDVIVKAAEQFGWATTTMPPNHGRGIGFARYKNHAAYLALVVEVEVERDSGRLRIVRAVAAIDSGEIVNPDGIRNQTEGGILQAASWTLYEAVSFDDTRITSIDWSSYPILRFGAVPDSIEVHIMDRPGEPFLGTAEAAQGPTAAAIGNALRDATGKRFTDLPLNRARVKQLIGA
ncbi:MAG TPA: molybdopterin cofactor-binding domain-containing protein [Geminicoccus sp.]|jgi:CO/xanthine dehydrogenase Mo-binding subunit|uniref:xanthine dehydrogenase family protein molybdopterin-binding subunit n=1 Tax=Geminicoccus sp. TaxID=2024832 RepID=UPI002E32D23C|nr:molybdopterin cofactor-binding domain-containing protein [Geminicoccus sp.]HEX2528878.1 molybdopterin cofactor-binding domain-containing protein [Geminicoccus sp.]